jgi:hypothetical protein
MPAFKLKAFLPLADLTLPHLCTFSCFSTARAVSPGPRSAPGLVRRAAHTIRWDWCQADPINPRAGFRMHLLHNIPAAEPIRPRELAW